MSFYAVATVRVMIKGVRGGEFGSKPDERKGSFHGTLNSDVARPLADIFLKGCCI